MNNEVSLETLLIEKPTEKQIKKFADLYRNNARLSPIWGSGLKWYQKLERNIENIIFPPLPDLYQKLAEQSMSTNGKLLLSGMRRDEILKRFYPLGFIAYLVNQKSLNDVTENTNLFVTGPLKYSPEVLERRLKNRDLYGFMFAQQFLGILLGGSLNDPDMDKGNLKNFSPYNQYSGGPIVYIQTIEVDPSWRRRGIGKELLGKLIETEKPEIVEGLADPTSLGFWIKQGFTVLPLYQKQLTAISWRNPTYS